MVGVSRWEKLRAFFFFFLQSLSTHFRFFTILLFQMVAFHHLYRHGPPDLPFSYPPIFLVSASAAVAHRHAPHNTSLSWSTAGHMRHSHYCMYSVRGCKTKQVFKFWLALLSLVTVRVFFSLCGLIEFIADCFDYTVSGICIRISKAAKRTV